MDISLKFAPKAEAHLLLEKLLTEEFLIDNNYADKIINNPNHGLIRHFNQLKDSCFIMSETNYVDKVYRDSYYSYYSTKLTNYKRNCIRLSIFDREIKADEFRNLAMIEDIQNHYLGFIILRPIEPYIIGRSIISPRALEENNFYCCI